MGYGDSGWPPHTYYLRGGQDVDVGVLKLFLSRYQVNLSHVAQSSPFVPVPNGGHSTELSTAPSSPSFAPGPVEGHSKDPSSPFVPGPVVGHSTESTAPSSPFVSRGMRLAILQQETPDPKTWRFPWDTVEIPVVQRQANNLK